MKEPLQSWRPLANSALAMDASENDALVVSLVGTCNRTV